MPFTGKLLQVIAQLYTASCGSCTYCNSACWQYSCAAYAYVRTCLQLIMLCLLLCLSWFIKSFHIANHYRISCVASLSNNAMEWQIVCLLLDVPCVFVEGCATVPQCLCCGRWSLASITRLVMPIVQLVLYVDCDWYMEHPGCHGNTVATRYDGMGSRAVVFIWPAVWHHATISDMRHERTRRQYQVDCVQQVVVMRQVGVMPGYTPSRHVMQMIIKENHTSDTAVPGLERRF